VKIDVLEMKCPVAQITGTEITECSSEKKTKILMYQIPQAECYLLLQVSVTQGQTLNTGKCLDLKTSYTYPLIILIAGKQPLGTRGTRWTIIRKSSNNTRMEERGQVIMAAVLRALGIHFIAGVMTSPLIEH